MVFIKKKAYIAEILKPQGFLFLYENAKNCLKGEPTLFLKKISVRTDVMPEYSESWQQKIGT